MGTPEKKIPISLDWGKIRDDSELDPEIFKPVKSPSAEMARHMEHDLFVHMKAWHVSKVYFWDDFHSDGSNARWDWCFAPIPPEGKACREHNFANLVAMDDWHFERLVRSLPKSPNEDIVREWRKEMRKDPLIIQAAKAEAPPMDWSDLKFDPDLIKKVIKKELL